jgi:ELWxxDGT repeat protein
VGNRIFFIADDGVHGRELWVTDGSTEGTHMVADLVPGAGGIVTEQLEQMTSFRGLLYFRFNDGEYNHGFELWVSDGTTLGTHLFKDIGTGLDQFGYAASSYPDELTVVGGKMFFSAWDPVYARELWETDGTVEGTRIVADMSTVNNSSVYQSSNPNQLANINGELYFSAKNYQYLNYPESGYEVWRLQQPVIKRIRLCPGIMGLLLD